MRILIALALFVCGSTASWTPAMENPDLLEGDIMLTPDQDQNLNSFGSIRSKRWTNGVIPYVFNSNIRGNKKFIEDAFEDYQKDTCLRFVPRTTQTNYVEFNLGTGCNSYVGMIGRRQIINLGHGCHHKSTAIHEIGHALGLHHEQNRPDRDNYVTIHLNNLGNQKWAYAFNKKSTWEVDSLGTPYDFKSVMHYQSTAFARSGKKTIVVKPKYYLEYQSVIDNNYYSGLSKIDIKQVNLMYKCPAGSGTGSGTGGSTGGNTGGNTGGSRKKDIRNKGVNCWVPCNGRSGKCSNWCGSDGYCCRAGWTDSRSYQCRNAESACRGHHCCTAVRDH